MREVEKRGRDTMRKKSGREIHVERERKCEKRQEKVGVLKIVHKN